MVPLTLWPWSADVFVGPKFDALRLWVTLAALAVGVQLMADERVAVRLRLPDVFVVVYLVLGALALALSVDRHTSLYGEPLQQAGFLTSLALIVTYAVARVAVTSVRRLGSLLTTVAIVGTVVAGYGFVQLAHIDPFWSSLPKGRVFSSIGQPNWLAAYLVMTVPITVALMIMAKRKTLSALGAVAVILQVAVVVATGSRSGYLGLATALAIGSLLLIWHIRRENRVRAKAIGVAVVGVAVVGVAVVIALAMALSSASPEVSPSSAIGRAVSILDVGGFDAQRYVALWEVGAAIAVDHPLSGSGQDTYAVMFPTYRDRILEPTYANHFAAFRPESPHNVYLGVASGTGIPALITYFAVIGFAMATLIGTARAGGRVAVFAGAILVALMGHLVTDFFMTMDLSGSWLCWALLGVAISLDQLEMKQSAPVDLAARPSV